MKQLSGIDATFLYMETRETPMHVAGLTLYEPPKDLKGSFHAHFKSFFATRLHLVPIFSQKLAKTVFELDHPGWVEAREVDLDYHIEGVRLPAPGDFAQIEALVGELHGVRLDRKRPLWKFTVIEGLADGRVAIYTKVHHAAVDGAAGMAIMQAIYDFTAAPRQVPAPAPRTIAPKPSTAERALSGVNDLVNSLMRQHIQALEAGAQMMGTVAELLKPQGAGEGGGGGGLGGLSGVNALIAPKTPFNITITPKRVYAARSLSLADAKLIAKATGTKINDVVMAICAGALRRYLLDKKKLPKTPLIAFVPISLRQAGNTDTNNQVFGMNCPLATEIADPLERLKTIQKTTNNAKTVAGVTKDAAPKDFTLLGAPLLLPGLMKLFGRTGLADVAPMAVNVVISNVPGPQFPVYCAGAKVTSLYPVSIPVHGIGLNLTVQSYLGKLDFGLTGDAKAMPDIHVLADFVPVALEELKAAAVGQAEEGETADAQA